MTVYLVIGTGKPCAWHNSVIVELAGFLNELVPESDGNVGALEPIGSLRKEQKWKGKWVLATKKPRHSGPRIVTNCLRCVLEWGDHRFTL